MEYLTEKNLGILLKKIFPENEFIHDKTIPNSNSRKRPDYRNDDLMLILEFDGDNHYKSAEKIKSEESKNQIFHNLGYKIIRIPYFVQLTKQVMENLFGIDFTPEYKFPHGFISKNCVLPADFCELGIEKFLNDLKRFDFIAEEIINSLKNKIEEKGDWEVVIPKSLKKILK